MTSYSDSASSCWNAAIESATSKERRLNCRLKWLWRSKDTMAKAYSDDLRRKILEGYDRELGSLRELAERFCVSYAWARKISWQRRRTGQMERVEQRHGSPSRATAEVEARLRRLLR